MRLSLASELSITVVCAGIGLAIYIWFPFETFVAITLIVIGTEVFKLSL